MAAPAYVLFEPDSLLAEELQRRLIDLCNCRSDHARSSELLGEDQMSAGSSRKTDSGSHEGRPVYLAVPDEGACSRLLRAVCTFQRTSDATGETAVACTSRLHQQS